MGEQARRKEIVSVYTAAVILESWAGLRLESIYGGTSAVALVMAMLSFVLIPRCRVSGA